MAHNADDAYADANIAIRFATCNATLTLVIAMAAIPRTAVYPPTSAPTASVIATVTPNASYTATAAVLTSTATAGSTAATAVASSTSVTATATPTCTVIAILIATPTAAATSLPPLHSVRLALLLLLSTSRLLLLHCCCSSAESENHLQAPLRPHQAGEAL